MKKVLYDIVLNLLPIFLRLISPLNSKAAHMITGRKEWDVELSSAKLSEKRIWIHCASLGEFEQGRPIIEKVRVLYPQYTIVVSFFSPSGYEVQKNYKLADYVCYIPFDQKNEVRRFIEILKPDLVLFVKYEFWYNYLVELKRRQIPIFSVSAIFRPEQQFFKKSGGFFREMLSCFEHFFVQNELSKKLLNRRGFQNVSISGDTRFDRVMEISQNVEEIEIAKLFRSNSKVMVIGSSWPDDMRVLYPIINNLDIDLKFIIAPHEVDKRNIQKLCSGLQVEYQLMSDHVDQKIPESRVLVIDCIGKLSALYQYGSVAYIGGAFGDGLHNILEAATFGLPIFFGADKSNHKFQEAIDLLSLGGAFEVSNAGEMHEMLTQLLNDEEKLEDTSQITKQFIGDHLGATKHIVNHLSKYMK